jgi:hypothetical protein
MLRRMLATVMILATALGTAGHAAATTVDGDTGADTATPPRLSYAAGAVSFWRPGGDDWAPAQVNTPLAEGDELYTGRDGNVELQVGGRGFVRAWGDTQLGVLNDDPNFLQLRVAAGHVALDLRTLDAGHVVEVDTPAAAFTIDQAGYYRVDVAAERTTFSTPRSGRATITTAGGPVPAIAPGEAVSIENGAMQRLAAPDPDVWDRWNEARTAALIAPASAPYVSAEVYGASDLDRYGAWRSDPTYGAVWMPANVAAGWAPYSTGRWIWDPRFGWTWLDAAPWGWAPYHYGRWVWLGGVWAWAPGPVVVRPAYAPALVAFLGTPVSGVQVAGPSVCWVALGWGEPVVPWWGRAGFVGRPWWGGWGGPRVQHVTAYRNVTVVNAVVAVRSDQFGRRAVQDARIAHPDVRHLQPVHGRLDVKPEPVSFRGAGGHAPRPPQEQVTRRVVSTRPAAPRVTPPPARDDRRDERHDQQPGGRPAPRPDVRHDGERGPRAIETPRVVAPRPEVPRSMEPRRPEPPRVEPPRAEIPRGETRRPEMPRAEIPRGETRRPELPRAEIPRVVAPRPEPPRAEIPRVVTPRPEAPRAEIPRAEIPRGETRRPELPRAEIPRGEMRRPEPPRAEAPRMERAAAAESARRPEAVRPAVQHPTQAAPAAQPGRPQDDRAHRGR